MKKRKVGVYSEGWSKAQVNLSHEKLKQRKKMTQSSSRVNLRRSKQSSSSVHRPCSREKRSRPHLKQSSTTWETTSPRSPVDSTTHPLETLGAQSAEASAAKEELQKSSAVRHYFPSPGRGVGEHCWGKPKCSGMSSTASTPRPKICLPFPNQREKGNCVFIVNENSDSKRT